MKPSIKQQEDYWDKTWTGRCDHDDPLIVTMNKYKMKFLIHMLAERPYYEHLRKLDVGCGTMIHHGFLRQIYPSWPNGLVGIDLSQTAIEKARYFGFEAYCESFYDIDDINGFDAFFFMDSLEHFDDLVKVVNKLYELGRGDYYIFGNIPLYSGTDHAVSGGFERLMDVNVLLNFFGVLGFHGFWQKIHGSCGYPYMVFEARKSGDIGNQQDEGTILLPKLG